MKGGSNEELDELKKLREILLANHMITDTTVLMNEALKAKKKYINFKNMCLKQRIKLFPKNNFILILITFSFFLLSPEF